MQLILCGKEILWVKMHVSFKCIASRACSQELSIGSIPSPWDKIEARVWWCEVEFEAWSCNVQDQ